MRQRVFRLLVAALLVWFVIPFLFLQVHSLLVQPQYRDHVDFFNDVWQWDLPETGYEIIYKNMSKSPAFGEGYRFHVIQYEEEFVQAKDWPETAVKNVMVFFDTSIENLPLDPQYLPDFQATTFVRSATYKNTEGSQFQLIYFDQISLAGEQRQHILYILEDIR